MAHLHPITKEPDPILRRKAVGANVSKLSDATLQKLIDDMIATMWAADGIGIAAPQVGASLRIVIITNGQEAIPLINPSVSRLSFKKEFLEERLLSVPRQYGKGRRSASVRVSAYDRSGQPFSFKASGLVARIVQHELDHLNGILFIDRAKQVVELPPQP